MHLIGLSQTVVVLAQCSRLLPAASRNGALPVFTEDSSHKVREWGQEGSYFLDSDDNMKREACALQVIFFSV